MEQLVQSGSQSVSVPENTSDQRSRLSNASPLNHTGKSTKPDDILPDRSQTNTSMDFPSDDIVPDGPTADEPPSFQPSLLSLHSDHSLFQRNQRQLQRQTEQERQHPRQAIKAQVLIDQGEGSNNTFEFPIDVDSPGMERGVPDGASIPGSSSSQQMVCGNQTPNSHGRLSNPQRSSYGSRAGRSSITPSAGGGSCNEFITAESPSDSDHDPNSLAGGLNFLVQRVSNSLNGHAVKQQKR